MILEYRVSVEQEPERPMIVYPNGFTGVLAIRWPKRRSSVDGEMGGIKKLGPHGTRTEVTERTVREANYDFVANRSASRDGTRLGQIGGFRTPFSAQFCFPLAFQDYVEVAQQYVDGEPLRTDQWLPNCLRQYRYEYVGQEDVGGAPCVILERKGWDKLWIDTAHGYLVARRERTYGPHRGLRQRTENLAAREVAPAIWIPTQQIREQYEMGATNPACRMTLDITKVRVGDVRDADLEVVFPQEMERIEDATTCQTMQGDGSLADRLDRALQRESGIEPVKQRRVGLLHAVLGIAASLLAFVIYRVQA